ncbi:hypothetical protein T484DRAFT_1777111 [Baffinella frigidus]|nr:hypothetical protein T484DRAFT_1777111 [Cryptophyta sp. CCMP2293]
MEFPVARLPKDKQPTNKANCPDLLAFEKTRILGEGRTLQGMKALTHKNTIEEEEEVVEKEDNEEEEEEEEEVEKQEKEEEEEEEEEGEEEDLTMPPPPAPTGGDEEEEEEVVEKEDTEEEEEEVVEKEDTVADLAATHDALKRAHATEIKVDVEALKEGATKTGDNLVPFARAVNPLKPQGATKAGDNLVPFARAVNPLKPQEAARPKEGAKVALSLEEYKRRRNLA